MRDMQLEQQKHHFWIYITIAATIVMLTTSHGSQDYIHAQPLVTEDSSYSVYKK